MNWEDAIKIEPERKRQELKDKRKEIKKRKKRGMEKSESTETEKEALKEEKWGAQQDGKGNPNSAAQKPALASVPPLHLLGELGLGPTYKSLCVGATNTGGRTHTSIPTHILHPAAEIQTFMS